MIFYKFFSVFCCCRKEFFHYKIAQINHKIKRAFQLRKALFKIFESVDYLFKA